MKAERCWIMTLSHNYPFYFNSPWEKSQKKKTDEKKIRMCITLHYLHRVRRTTLLQKERPCMWRGAMAAAVSLPVLGVSIYLLLLLFIISTFWLCAHLCAKSVWHMSEVFLLWTHNAHLSKQTDFVCILVFSDAVCHHIPMNCVTTLLADTALTTRAIN